jgi:hypothetical protein
MTDCPDNISLDECLKRKLKKAHLQKDSDKHNSVAPLLVIKSQQMTSTFKETTLGEKSSNTNTGGTSSNNTHSSNMNSASISSSFGGGGGGGSRGGGFSFGGGSDLIGGGHVKSPSKGGVVVQNRSVIVKSNFEMAGRLNKQGKRNSAKTLGSHASASLNYMENHGVRDLERDEALSNIYDPNGERLSKEEYAELKNDLNDGVSAFRRTVIDVGHNELDREALNRLVRESVQEFQEKSGKQFEYTFAIHTDTEHIHAHVLSFGESHEINMTKEHLQLFKEVVGTKTDELLEEHKLENDRDLSLNQQIDGALSHNAEIQSSQYKELGEHKYENTFRIC